MISDIVDEDGNYIFNVFAIKQIVNMALASRLPYINTANWAVTGKTK